jgi:hypothetical protein
MNRYVANLLVCCLALSTWWVSAVWSQEAGAPYAGSNKEKLIAITPDVGELIDANGSVALALNVGKNGENATFRLFDILSGAVSLQYVFLNKQPSFSLAGKVAKSNLRSQYNLNQLVSLSRPLLQGGRLYYCGLLRSRSDEYAIALLTVSNESIALENLIPIEIPKEKDVPFAKPKITLHYGPELAGKSKNRSNFVFVISDSSESRKSSMLLVVDASGKTKELLPPKEINMVFGVATPGIALGLNSRSGVASLFDLSDGKEYWNLSIPELSVRNKNSLSFFTSGISKEISAGIVLVNAENSSLVTMLVQRGYDEPTVSDPVRISMAEFKAWSELQKSPLVLADLETSTIVVSSSGSNKAIVLRRVNRGIEMLGELSLDVKVGSAAFVYEGTRNLVSGVAFLDERGSSLQVSPFVEKTEARKKTDLMDLDSDKSDDIKNESPFTFRSTKSENELSPDEVRNLQRTLATFGYSVGNIDGVFGVLTSYAVKNFQLDKDIPTTGTVDEQTVGSLNSEVKKIGLDDPDKQAYIEEFRKFVQRKVGDVNVTKLLELGNSHSNPKSRCFGLNDLPPRALWANVLPFAKILAKLETDYHLDVMVISGYRNSVYGRCASRGDEDGTHANFMGFDLRLRDAARGDVQIWNALNELRDKKIFKGAIGKPWFSTHVDTRDKNEDL